MIIVDTSVWIEFLKSNEAIEPKMSFFLEQGLVIAPECVFGELLQGAKNKSEIKIIEAYWHTLPKVKEEGLWVKAGIESCEKKYISKGVGIIDSLIIQLAKKTKSQVWTLDKKLLS